MHDGEPTHDAARLRAALAAGEIQAWFQPIVALPSGAVRGYEALVRWVRADGAPTQPAVFLPVAQDDDLVAIDGAALAAAVSLLARLKDRRHVAVNVSSASLADTDLPARVADVLGRANVAASKLRLEVAAASLASIPAQAVTAMRLLADQGVAWYVDGAGTAAVAAADLGALPVAGIKLDPACTSQVTAEGSAGAAAARDVLAIAQDLGLDSVAGGIETRGAADALAAHGWAHGQGWLFGRPMPPDLVR